MNPALRSQTIALVAQDVQRNLAQTRRALARTQPEARTLVTLVAVSEQQWLLFYPALSFIVPEEDTPIILRCTCRYTPTEMKRFMDAGDWVLESWCVVMPEPDGLRQRTRYATRPFGEALPPDEEMDGELYFHTAPA